MFNVKTPSNQTKPILIVGAGIAGLMLARLLKERKIPFKIVEKRSEFTIDGTGIALPANAMQIIESVGLKDKVMKSAHQATEIIYAQSNGEELSRASLLDVPLNCAPFIALTRDKLHKILNEGFEKDVELNTTINSLTQHNNGVTVELNCNDRVSSEEFAAVIAADGVHSKTRELIFPEIKLEDMGVTIWRFICDYDTSNLQPIYSFGHQKVCMVYPISSDQVYIYAHVVDPEKTLLSLKDTQSNLREQFKQFGGIIAEILQRLPESSAIIPGRLRSVPQPVFAKGCVVFIGDAGHACSPMLQQGAALAWEDAVVLAEFLKRYPSIEEVFSEYEKFRSTRVNAVVSGSDNPMRRVMHITQDQHLLMLNDIAANGPLNVRGWKMLLATNVLTQLHLI